MDKNTKITLAELIKRKEQVLEAKKSPKKARIYVKSLDGEIIIKAPTKSLATEAAEMENDGDAHLVYECVAEPDLHSKELQDAYGCTYPEEIVEKLFDAGEITPIAMECMKLAGYVDSVKLVEEVKYCPKRCLQDRKLKKYFSLQVPKRQMMTSTQSGRHWEVNSFAE